MKSVIREEKDAVLAELVFPCLYKAVAPAVIELAKEGKI